MLKQISGQSYFYNDKICTGVFILHEGAVIVDAGIDEDYSRKLINAINSKVSKLILTHSHGDHYGGAGLIQKRTGCRIFAPRIEATIIEHPEIEPMYLYGASPIDELKNKFFMGKSVKVDSILEEGKHDGFEVMLLPGHSPNMAAVLSQEGVLYASDAFFTHEVMEKYKIPYLFDVEQMLISLERIKRAKFNHAVLAHGGLLTYRDAITAIDENIARLEQVGEKIHSFLRHPNTIEGVMDHLSAEYDLYVAVGQYFLNLSIVKAYLTYLRKKGRMNCQIEGKRLLWKSL
ncbi:MAG: MBL fold metallo-hydrolase [Nanoarchaeota archaeon]|nr:MBL fold metallo-hydrolase [Nanoarchaeota archaeon]